MNAETINPIGTTIAIAIAVVWLACVVVCFLKGKPWSAILGIAAVSRKTDSFHAHARARALDRRQPSIRLDYCRRQGALKVPIRA
jgi:hypothetical protein